MQQKVLLRDVQVAQLPKQASQRSFKSAEPFTTRKCTFKGILQHLNCRDQRLTSLTLRAAATVEYGSLSDLGVSADTYIVLGLAHCFEKNDEGKLSNRMVIEPIAANSLECMVLGAKTCFKAAVGMTMQDALSRDKSLLPPEFQEASYCNEFQVRCGASARTWTRPHAMDNLLLPVNEDLCTTSLHAAIYDAELNELDETKKAQPSHYRDLVPLGQTKSNFNFNLDEKRVLNFENEVSDSDNIKQDMSIDVYGRKDDEEAPAAAAAATPPPQKAKAASKEEDDDDLDSLLDM